MGEKAFVRRLRSPGLGIATLFTILAISALVGFFLLLAGVAERPGAARISIELAMILPFIAVVIWRKRFNP